MKKRPKFTDPGLPARFAAKVDRRGANECWPWTGCRNSCGYGRIALRGPVRSVIATHAALWLDGRPRPEGAIALHSCDNPACVNPAHLRWGSHADNVSDMMNRQRQVPASLLGTRNANARLTEADVLAIRASRETQEVLAARYGLSADYIYEVRTGRRWKHLPGAIHLKPRKARARNGGSEPSERLAA